MKLYREESLSNFEFWSGARERAKYLNDNDFDTIESILEELYPEGADETTVNDLFWFEEDTIAEWLGYLDFEELIADRTDEE